MKERIEEPCCGNCIEFKDEDAYGYGWCIPNKCVVHCGGSCEDKHIYK